MKVVVRALGRRWYGEVYRDSLIGAVVIGFWFPHGRGFTKRTNVTSTLMSSRSPIHCGRKHCLDGGCAASFRKGTAEFTNLCKLLAGPIRKVSVSVAEPAEGHLVFYVNRVIASLTSSRERLEEPMDREKYHRVRKG